MNETERAEVLARLDRLERLEEQVFFQEQTISALNDALTGQQRQLDIVADGAAASLFALLRACLLKRVSRFHIASHLP